MRDLIETKRLSTGATIMFFADGKYKFQPSIKYQQSRTRYKSEFNLKSSSSNCLKLVENIFKVKVRGYDLWVQQ